MNVLFLNGNQKLNNSTAAWFYTPFIESLQNNGNNIKTIFLQRKKILACKGCLHCWFIEQGKCIIKDDFESIIQWLNWADQLIFIFPIYVGNAPSIIFHFIQRCVSTTKPTYEIYKKHYGHVLNDSISFPSFGVISWCGFYEKDNFEGTNAQMKQVSYFSSQEYNISIFRPHINAFEFFPEKKQAHIELLKTAGKQFSKNRKIEKVTLEEIEKDIIRSDEYFSLMNNLLKAKIDDNKR
jgi:FMN-dependent NADH-azoreductase